MRFEGFGLRVQELGGWFRIQGLKFECESSGFGVLGLESQTSFLALFLSAFAGVAFFSSAFAFSALAGAAFFAAGLASSSSDDSSSELDSCVWVQGSGVGMERLGVRIWDGALRFQGLRLGGLGFKVQSFSFGLRISQVRVQASGLEVEWCLRSRVQGLGCRVQCSGFGVQSSVFRVWGAVYRARGSGFRVQCAGVQGAGFSAQGAGLSVQGAGFKG